MNIQACVSALIENLNAKHAVISPGSRNAPIIQSLEASGYACSSVVDERSAGFIALGMAQVLKQPIVLNCTSGTASANYYPAIIEAFYARIPLIIITADRPPEQIDAWDGQAIRQKGLYKNHIVAEFQCPDNYDDPEAFSAIAKRVNACLENEIAGPIHINVPIREPFYSAINQPIKTRQMAVGQQAIQSVTVKAIAAEAGMDYQNKKVLVFNGMQDGEQVVVASNNDAVIISDITSNQFSDIHYWDALLFVAQSNVGGTENLEVLQPDILITTGTTTVSKGLKRFLHVFPPKEHLHISKSHSVGKMFKTDPKVINPQLIQKLPQEEKDIDGNREGIYLAAWLNLANEFESRFAALPWDHFNEFSAFNYCLNNLPKNTSLHLSNSMPIRYASFLLNSDVGSNDVFCNRGTSGIDGGSSTAVGHAMASSNNVYLITGDVAFLYDINALYNTNLPDNLRIVILNNLGGGIFDLIGGPEVMGTAKKYQTTSHSYTAKHLAKHFGLEYYRASSLNDVANGMDSLRRSSTAGILEIMTTANSNIDFFNKFKSIWH